MLYKGIGLESGVSYLQFLGLVLVILGVILFVLPALIERMPSLEKIPWILIYVYRSGNFTFVTSPILIIISIASFILYLIQNARS